MKNKFMKALLLLCLPAAVLLPLPGVTLAGELRVRVNIDGRVRRIELEDYVGGVVFGEVGPGWPAEALKAMAVCARTFALNRVAANIDRPWHLVSGVSDQVYRDGHRRHAAILEAVAATRGEVLTYRGDLAMAFYHADSGGFTAGSETVWGGAFPYLRGIPDPYSTRAGRYADWTLAVPAADLLGKMGLDGRLASLEVLDRSACRRVGTLLLRLACGRRLEITGRHLREQVLGSEKLRSVLFDVSLDDGRVVFSGSGYGHGVGLSQWGARQMAEEDFGYRDILRFYFPGTDLHLARFD